MASIHSSPTAQLLRGSRLFSLPAPLPPARSIGADIFHTSANDTLAGAYPTHATIETRTSALSRGDWGLKRPLPAKTTHATSTPVVRVQELDTEARITDFESAADHTLTLRKWQELHMPITRQSGTSRQSAFEAQDHATQRTKAKQRRWRYDGPWLAGMEAGEFQTYVNRTIKKRRAEFDRFLRQKVVQEKSKKMQGHSKASTMDPVELSSEELEVEIIKLRQGGGNLWDYLWEFLDLPGKAPPSTTTTHGFGTEMQSSNGAFAPPRLDPTIGQDEELQSEMMGSPATHLSAGLSYLRNRQFIPNHPLLGPVQVEPPVCGRSMNEFAMDSRRLGVAGVITLPARRASADNRMVRTGFHAPGGPKIWVTPATATVDVRGRVQLGLHTATTEALAVWENVYEVPSSFQAGSAPTRAAPLPTAVITKSYASASSAQ